MTSSVTSLVLLMSVTAGLPLNAHGQTAVIHVQVLTFLDEPLESARVALFQRGTNKELRGAFSRRRDEYVAARVPLGEYVLKVSSPGMRNHEQRLMVRQSLLSFRVFMRVGALTDVPPSRITGTVKRRPVGKELLWVKLLPLLSNESLAETEVQGDGRFEFVGLDEGDYVLVVMKGTKAVYMKQVSLYGSLDVRVDLP
jgi:hypothetical protein